MAFTWPEFDTKQALDAGHSWTAAFDSYDQYRELCYYKVAVFDGERRMGEFMVEVGTESVGDNDWGAPAFVADLHDRIARVVATGKTNTAYEG